MAFERVDEAPLTDTEAGRAPRGEGWFIVNVADATGIASDTLGSAAIFEGDVEFPDYGINVHVLRPGEPNCMYHRENQQEDFLVLSGECIAIVEEEERPMRKGDFLHTPAGTAHVFVGAGAGPCGTLMVGPRKEPAGVLSPPSAAAGRYCGAVERETPDPKEAYAGHARRRAPLGHVPW